MLGKLQTVAVGKSTLSGLKRAERDYVVTLKHVNNALNGRRTTERSASCGFVLSSMFY